MSDQEESSQETRGAYALQYQDPKELPRLLASGSGHLAELILSIAKEHNIPIEDRSDLAGVLKEVPLHGSLPKESLGIIAEVIAFLYHCNEEWAKKHAFLEKI